MPTPRRSTRCSSRSIRSATRRPKLKDYLSSFNPRLKGVGGDAEALAAVAKAYRVYYKKVPLKDGDYTMDHTAIVYLMDKTGAFVAPFSLKRRPEDAAADLRRYF